MATIPSGQVVRIQIPSAQSLTFTPGTGGRISLNGRTLFGEAIAPREIYVATSISFNAGDVVSAEAVNGDATHTDPSAGSGSTAYSDLTGVPTDNPALSSALDGKVPTTRTVNGQALSGNVTLAKSDVGLGNVDNTSDASKPISDATAAALSDKVGSSSPTFSGTMAGANATFSGTVTGATVNATNSTVTGTANVPTVSSVSDASTKAVSTQFLTTWDLKRAGAYTPPTNEAVIETAAQPASVSAGCDWISTVISDGDRNFVNWAGNGQELVMTMTDGTEFLRYFNGSADVLKRSPTGGGTDGGAWTTVATTTTTMGYSVLLRDRASDSLLYFVLTGSSLNWSLRCRAYNSAGTQLADYTLPYNGFLQGLTASPYVRGGIGPDGQFVLVQPDQYWPAQENNSGARGVTKQMLFYIQRGLFTKTSGSTGTFTFDTVPIRFFTEDRWAYHVPFMGLTGDPDYVCGVMGRDVRNDEDRDYMTNLNGSSTGFYNFDQVAFWYYNFRTRDRGWFPITPRTGFLNNIAKIRVTYAAGSTSAVLQEVAEGSVRVGQSLTNLTGSVGATGVVNGTTISALSGTTPGSTITLSAATVAGGSGGVAVSHPDSVLLSATDPTPSTPQNRYMMAIKSSDGFIYLTYQKVRHVSTGGAAITAGQSLRILKLSAKGEVLYDEPLMCEVPTGSGIGVDAFGYHTMWENPATSVKYVCRVAEGSQQTQVHFMRLYESPTPGSTTTGTTTSGSFNVTIPAGHTGLFLPGMYISGTGMAAGTRILRWSTYTPSAGGVIQVTQSATATSAGAASLTTRGVVACEGLIAANSINNVWGTNSAYLGIAQTLPARSSGFLAWTCDDRAGSALRGNKASVFISRRINDHPSASSGTNNERIEQISQRFPA